MYIQDEQLKNNNQEQHFVNKSSLTDKKNTPRQQ